MRESLRLWKVREIGHRERRDRELLLPGEVEGGPAGDEHAEARTGGEQGGELGCCLDHLLEVVQ